MPRPGKLYRADRVLTVTVTMTTATTSHTETTSSSPGQLLGGSASVWVVNWSGSWTTVISQLSPSTPWVSWLALPQTHQLSQTLGGVKFRTVTTISSVFSYLTHHQVITHTEVYCRNYHSLRNGYLQLLSENEQRRVRRCSSPRPISQSG